MYNTSFRLTTQKETKSIPHKINICNIKRYIFIPTIHLQSLSLSHTRTHTNLSNTVFLPPIFPIIKNIYTLKYCSKKISIIHKNKSGKLMTSHISFITNRQNMTSSQTINTQKLALPITFL